VLHLRCVTAALHAERLLSFFSCEVCPEKGAIKSARLHIELWNCAVPGCAPTERCDHANAQVSAPAPIRGAATAPPASIIHGAAFLELLPVSPQVVTLRHFLPPTRNADFDLDELLRLAQLLPRTRAQTCVYSAPHAASAEVPPVLLFCTDSSTLELVAAATVLRPHLIHAVLPWTPRKEQWLAVACALTRGVLTWGHAVFEPLMDYSQDHFSAIASFFSSAMRALSDAQEEKAAVAPSSASVSPASDAAGTSTSSTDDGAAAAVLAADLREHGIEFKLAFYALHVRLSTRLTSALVSRHDSVRGAAAAAARALRVADTASELRVRNLCSLWDALTTASEVAAQAGDATKSADFRTILASLDAFRSRLSSLLQIAATASEYAAVLSEHDRAFVSIADTLRARFLGVRDAASSASAVAAQKGHVAQSAGFRAVADSTDALQSRMSRILQDAATASAGVAELRAADRVLTVADAANALRARSRSHSVRSVPDAAAASEVTAQAGGVAESAADGWHARLSRRVQPDASASASAELSAAARAVAVAADAFRARYCRARDCSAATPALSVAPTSSASSVPVFVPAPAPVPAAAAAHTAAVWFVPQPGSVRRLLEWHDAADVDDAMSELLEWRPCSSASCKCRSRMHRRLRGIADAERGRGHCPSDDVFVATTASMKSVTLAYGERLFQDGDDSFAQAVTAAAEPLWSEMWLPPPASAEAARRAVEAYEAWVGALPRDPLRRVPWVCAAAPCSAFAPLKCSRCFQCCYCSEECQRRHWRREHKALCAEPPSPGQARP
jgi:hypothetical protein